MRRGAYLKWKPDSTRTTLYTPTTLQTRTTLHYLQYVNSPYTNLQSPCNCWHSPYNY